MASKRSASASCLCLAAISCFLVGALQNLTFTIPKQIEEAAQNKGISPAQYLKDVSNRAELYRKSNAVAGREEFVKKLNEAVQLSYPLFLMNLFYFCLEFRGSVWLSKFMRLLDGFSSPFLIGCERTSAQLNCDTVQDVTQLRQAMGKSGLHLVIGRVPRKDQNCADRCWQCWRWSSFALRQYASPEQSPVNGCIGMFARRS